ncbi:unnamed protein product [Mytilus coruscus]|uniref:Uncharacterized protein n=1 Tax=Mytilus coruscus TaxID=42192 RepID=A0A6J8EAF2_MYTCO|nr:unnamed protein product [Mytilus coruscus]
MYQLMIHCLQDTGSVVAGDALHPGDQSEDDEQEHFVSLESEVESVQESTIIVDDDIEHSNSDINQGSETNDIVVNNQEDIAPTPAPRRSKRTTTQPNWMKSGEFIMAQQSNWLAKAEFLKGLAMSGMFPSAEMDIGRALVKIAMIDLYSTCIVIFNYTLDLGIFQRCYGQVSYIIYY